MIKTQQPGKSATVVRLADVPGIDKETATRLADAGWNTVEEWSRSATEWQPEGPAGAKRVFPGSSLVDCRAVVASKRGIDYDEATKASRAVRSHMLSLSKGGP